MVDGMAEGCHWSSETSDTSDSSEWFDEEGRLILTDADLDRIAEGEIERIMEYGAPVHPRFSDQGGHGVPPSSSESVRLIPVDLLTRSNFVRSARSFQQLDPDPVPLKEVPKWDPPQYSNACPRFRNLNDVIESSPAHMRNLQKYSLPSHYRQVKIDEEFEWEDWDYGIMRNHIDPTIKPRVILPPLPQSASVSPMNSPRGRKNSLERQELMKEPSSKRGNKMSNLMDIPSNIRRSSVFKPSLSLGTDRRPPNSDDPKRKELNRHVEKYVDVKKFGRRAEKLGQALLKDAAVNDMDFKIEFESTESDNEAEMFEEDRAPGVIDSGTQLTDHTLTNHTHKISNTTQARFHDSGALANFNRGVDASSANRTISLMLNTWIFEFLTWVLIIVNTVALTIVANYKSTLEETHKLADVPRYIQGLSSYNTFYHFYFVFEVLLKSTVAGSSFIDDSYNVKDVVLILLMYIPYGYATLYGGSGHGWDPEVWFSISVVRLLRVVRFVDWVRYEPFFHELYILVKGHASSTKVLVWAMLFGALLQYVFSVFISTIITDGLQFEHRLYEGWFLDLYGIDTTVYSRDLFGRIDSSMVSLFRIMTLDNWSELIDPLVTKSVFLKGFFCIYVMVAVYGFQNLVTAVIVEASTQLQKEEESRLERLFLRKVEDLGLLLENKIGKKKRVTMSEMRSIYVETPSIQKVMRVFGIMDVSDLESLLHVITDPRKTDDVRTKIKIKDILLAMTRYTNRNAKTRDVIELLAIAKRTNDEVYWQIKRIKKMKAEMRKFLRLILRKQELTLSESYLSSMSRSMSRSQMTTNSSRSSRSFTTITNNSLMGSQNSDMYCDIF